MVRLDQLHNTYERFMSYDTLIWERTLFDNNTCGYLVTSLQRIAAAGKSKNAHEIFVKEQKMCRKLVSFGFQLEHLSEIPGVSSPDIALKKHGYLVRINGKTADLKQLSSANNISRQAKEAIHKKKVNLVIFEFITQTYEIENEIRKLSKKGIHGYYYYSDSTIYSSF